MALVAATPGIIDFFGVVPPHSTGRTRALQHGASNVSATVLFGIAWVVRADASAEPGLAVLGLEAAALVLLTMGGWMGGTLVASNQIGIDHRYARAGKWKERRIRADPGAAEGTPITVASSDDLKTDQMMLVHVGERRIVLGRTEDGFVAFDDRCTHRGASLADGVLICGTVQCPWHGSQFDTRTGQVRAGPAEEEVRAYKVEESGGNVRVRL
jgi:nitrite reductase/ring-hydroxylating ferredoxin subunit